MRRARVQLWWYRWHVPDWLSFAAYAVGGCVLGLVLAMFTGADKKTANAVLAVLPLLFFLWMVASITRSSFGEEAKPGRPASAAFIVAAFEAMLPHLRGALHEEISKRAKRARHPLDCDDIVAAMDMIIRCHGPRTVAREAARAAAIAEQRRLLDTCKLRPRLTSGED
jgi:hypothetical protein